MSNVVLAALVDAEQDLLRDHYKKCVQQFLRTVVVFDDRAYRSVSPQDTTTIEVEPINPLASIGSARPLVSGEEAAKAEELVELVEDEAHELDGPALVRLFAQKGWSAQLSSLLLAKRWGRLLMK